MVTAEQAPLRGRAVRGVAVTTLGQVTGTLTQIISLIVLARLLTPKDFGLVAIVVSVIGVADIVRDLGLSTAAIRAPDLSREEQSNLFWVNAGAGLAMTLLAAASAPVIAGVFGEPQLVLLTVALSPSFLLSGLATQHRADLTRRMSFTRLAILDASAAIATLALAIWAAASGWGYWALVAPQQLVAALSVVGLLTMAGWLPGRYRRSVSIRRFLRLGIAFLAGGILAYASKVVDNLVVGRVFGAVDVGVYTRGVQLIRTPLTQLQRPFGTVLLPVLSRAVDDKERLVRTARTAQLGFSYPVAILVCIVVAAPGELIAVALGPQWVAAAFISLCAAIAGLISAVSYPAVWILNAMGVGRLILWFNVAGTAAVVGCVLIGALFGLRGIALALVASAVAGAGLCIAFLTLALDLNVRPMVIAGARILAITAVSSVVARTILLVVEPQPWLRLITACLTTLVLAPAWLTWPTVRKDAAELAVLARSIRST